MIVALKASVVMYFSQVGMDSMFRDASFPEWLSIYFLTSDARN